MENQSWSDKNENGDIALNIDDLVIAHLENNPILNETQKTNKTNDKENRVLEKLHSTKK